MHQMNNNGYFHYFFARIEYFINGGNELSKFKGLLKSRKHSSLILYPIFNRDEFLTVVDEQLADSYTNSVANYCLIRRDMIDEYKSCPTIKDKITFLLSNQYLPEMYNIDPSIPLFDFIDMRDENIAQIANRIWG